MVFYKIIAIIIAAGAGLLQVGLEYIWHDKRTKKHKRVRSFLIFLMVVGSISAAFLVFIDDRQTAEQVRTLTEIKESAEKATKAAEAREQKAVEAREKIAQELAQLQEQMRPVIELATAKYPSLDVDAAVLEIANDVQKLQKENEQLLKRTEALKKQTKELSERDYFHPLNAEIRNRVVESLNGILESNKDRSLQISIFCEKGNSLRQKVARQLVDILSESGIETKGPTAFTTFSSGVLPAVRVGLNREDGEIGRQLAEALNPYLNVRFVGKAANQNELGQISIAINGNPFFSEDGVVTFP